MRFARGRTIAAALLIAVLGAGCSSGNPPTPFSTTPYSGIPGGTATAPPSSSTPEESAPPGTIIWRDDFNGAAGSSPDPASWTYDLGAGGWGDGELQTYTSEPANVSKTGNGYLQISAQPDPATGGYTSARLVSRGLVDVTSGIIQASIKLPADKGVIGSFRLIGSNIATVGPAQAGEIDVAQVSQDPSTVYTTLSGPLVSNPATPWQLRSPFTLPTPADQGFHTYTLQKSPGQLAFAVDGTVTAVVQQANLPADDQWVFDGPVYLAFDVSVGGAVAGAPDASTVFPAQMLVDWVSLTTLPATPSATPSSGGG